MYVYIDDGFYFDNDGVETSVRPYWLRVDAITEFQGYDGPGFEGETTEFWVSGDEGPRRCWCTPEEFAERLAEAEGR